jgi:hypothetical protein
MHIICCPVMILLHEVLLFLYLAEAADSSPLDVMNMGNNISFIVKQLDALISQIYCA